MSAPMSRCLTKKLLFSRRRRIKEPNPWVFPTHFGLIKQARSILPILMLRASSALLMPMHQGGIKKSTSAVVLGAGGAAKAVVYGLLERGLKEVHVVNRTIEKAQAFRAAFGSAVHPVAWSDLPALIKRRNLVGQLDFSWDAWTTTIGAGYFRNGRRCGCI